MFFVNTQYEATSYIVPDTAEMESHYMQMTPKSFQKKRMLMWFRYALTGVVVSVAISGSLYLCKQIEKWRSLLDFWVVIASVKLVRCCTEFVLDGTIHNNDMQSGYAVQICNEDTP